jgi:hypothetical protein
MFYGDPACIKCRAGNVQLSSDEEFCGTRGALIGRAPAATATEASAVTSPASAIVLRLQADSGLADSRARGRIGIHQRFNAVAQ